MHVYSRTHISTHVRNTCMHACMHIHARARVCDVSLKSAHPTSDLLRVWVSEGLTQADS